MTLREQLHRALAELAEWSGEAPTKSHWNRMHGSVTGDYENQVVNTANADNAEKIALAAKVIGLSALMTAGGIQ